MSVTGDQILIQRIVVYGTLNGDTGATGEENKNTKTEQTQQKTVIMEWKKTCLNEKALKKRNLAIHFLKQWNLKGKFGSHCVCYRRDAKRHHELFQTIAQKSERNSEKINQRVSD